MAYVSGTAGSVVIVPSGTASVTGAHEWSLDLGQETPEVTAFGDSWKVFVPGIREWSGSFGLRHDDTSAVAGSVRGYLTGGSAPVKFRFAAGTNYYEGSALVTGASPEVAYDGVWETSYDIQGSGPLTYI